MLKCPYFSRFQCDPLQESPDYKFFVSVISANAYMLPNSVYSQSRRHPQISIEGTRLYLCLAYNTTCTKINANFQF